MPTLTIYGASDDLVEASGIEGADEFSTSGNWTGMIIAPGGDTAMVYVDYRNNGTWTVSLGQFEEGFKLPDWPVTTTVSSSHCGYSTFMTIDVPEGTYIQEIK